MHQHDRHATLIAPGIVDVERAILPDVHRPTGRRQDRGIGSKSEEGVADEGSDDHDEEQGQEEYEDALHRLGS